MSDATRLDTDMSHWAPVSRHYEITGGHIVVTKKQFLTAVGTDIYYCDERAVAHSMEPIASFPDGTTHNAALEALGYTVIDTIGDEPTQETTTPDAAGDTTTSVFDILPPEIAQMITAANIPSEETP